MYEALHIRSVPRIERFVRRDRTWSSGAVIEILKTPPESLTIFCKAPRSPYRHLGCTLSIIPRMYSLQSSLEDISLGTFLEVEADLEVIVQGRQRSLPQVDSHAPYPSRMILVWGTS